MSWWMLLDAVVAVESRSSVAPLASICGGVPGLTRRWKGSTGDTRCSCGWHRLTRTCDIFMVLGHRESVERERYCDTATRQYGEQRSIHLGRV